jgi:hypothetical protein
MTIRFLRPDRLGIPITECARNLDLCATATCYLGGPEDARIVERPGWLELGDSTRRVMNLGGSSGLGVYESLRVPPSTKDYSM